MYAHSVVRVLGLWLLAVTVVAGCGRAAPMANTHSSADAVAAAMLEALAASDRPRLEALALSDAEFRHHVWPELPAARPERNLPYAYVWGDLHQKSTLALSDTLAGHGGMRYELRRVRFAGQTRYQSYTVHRQATMAIRDASGAERDLRLCGSMIEKDGRWKVFSYVVDD